MVHSHKWVLVSKPYSRFVAYVCKCGMRKSVGEMADTWYYFSSGGKLVRKVKINLKGVIHW